MGKLAEYVRTEAEHLRAEQRGRKEAVAEWQSAMARLYAELETWIAEADEGHKLLVAGPGKLVYCREPRLGNYEIRSLNINLGIRNVEVAPKYRHVIATIAPPGAEP